MLSTVTKVVGVFVPRFSCAASVLVDCGTKTNIRCFLERDVETDSGALRDYDFTTLAYDLFLRATAPGD
jgi:hypothetical protein